MTSGKKGGSRAAKRASTTRKTSLYRLRNLGPVAEEDLTSLVAADYLERDGFTVQPVDYEGLQGLLLTGSVVSQRAEWCDALSTLTGQMIDEGNRTAFGLLLVRTNTAVYGLACGMGHLMIKPTRIDPGFGIDFAIRCLDEKRITKVRSQLMDARGRSEEHSVMAGEHITGFGIEKFGEIVNQISGKITDVPLTYTKRSKRVAHMSGTDRVIKLQLGKTPAALLHDLEAIEEVCARPNPVPELGFISQVRPIKPNTELAARLDENLEDMLGGGATDRMALAIPSDCRDRFEFAESFKVTIGGNPETCGELDVNELIALVNGELDGERLPALRAGRIEMFADEDGAERLSGQVRADYWLTAEVPEGAVHYFYWQGQWYEIGAEYLAVVESEIARLLARPASVILPPWTKGTKAEPHHEDWYNEQIATQEGYVLLDKQMIHTDRFRGGGLEIADGLGPSGQFICVKKADSTAPLNHLFAQGRVAIETLRYDRIAAEKFLAKLVPNYPLAALSEAPVVVFGIMLNDGKPVTADSLFAFAKISLLQAARALEGMGARLEIISISRTQPSGGSAPLPSALT